MASVQETSHEPYVPDQTADVPEFTLPAVLVGAVLGIVFGASSLYLVLKVGMTVSASVPIAVLSITLFRAFSHSFGFRRTSILENNIVQTTGSAGESIAFGVGVTMPALLLLGFEMDIVRVMTVSVLGGLLGVLMMIPLRRAFIVKQHGKLTYPEGTACAEVLIAGEKGGATARMVFLGFGIAVVHKVFMSVGKLWPSEPGAQLYTVSATGTKTGLKGAEIAGELSPELLGVGYLIGPRIASLMIGGAFLSYFVLGPAIALFGDSLDTPVSPAKTSLRLVSDDAVGVRGGVPFGGEKPSDAHAFWRPVGLVGAMAPFAPGMPAAVTMLRTRVEDRGLIRNMGPGELKSHYLRYIGAGAVAAGGILSMMRALPLILSSIVSGLRDLRATRAGGVAATRRTERDMPMSVVFFGSIGLVVLLAAVPHLGLGLGLVGLLGAFLILLLGFLFVTVSSRLTGEVGSSSNPISGMTIATLLLTCIIFLVLGLVEREHMLTALTVAAVVCIASSNGGTTSQDLKTGYLVGATPNRQQWAILVGALTSALVIGGTMLALDAAGTHYTTRDLPDRKLNIPEDAPTGRVGKPHEEDARAYYIVHVVRNDKLNPDVPSGRYYVEEDGTPRYQTDTPIAQEYSVMDNGKEAPRPFSAPQPRLFASIIEGILGGTLEWGLFVLGVLIALSVEFAGVSALPFAVGMYLPLSSSTPIFVGGLLRWLTDRVRGVSASEAETETSPGVLLSSGYIAGGTLAGLIIAFFVFLPDALNQALDLSAVLTGLGLNWSHEASGPVILSLVAFATLAVILFMVGKQRAAGGGETH